VWLVDNSTQGGNCYENSTVTLDDIHSKSDCDGTKINKGKYLLCVIDSVSVVSSSSPKSEDYKYVWDSDSDIDDSGSCKLYVDITTCNEIKTSEYEIKKYINVDIYLFIF
jgi:hypothetical protein